MNKTTLAFTAAVLFFVSTLILIYVNYLQPKVPTTTLNQNTSSSPSISPVVTKATDPTASWKTHNNTDLGFSFKYPESYISNKKSSESLFSVHSPDYSENPDEGAAGSYATAIYGYRLENQKCSRLITNSANDAVTSLILDTEGNPNLVLYKNEMSSPKPWANAYFDYSSTQCLVVSCSSDSSKGCGGGEIGVEFHKLLSTFKFTTTR